MPAPIGGRSEAQNREAVDAVIGDIITALTKFPVVTEGKDKGQEETITVTGKDYREASEKMTALFVEKLWGDGFPLIPPTKDAVEKMLKGTSHSPDEVLGVLEQRKGIATVKNVAINAVMAGCKPEYLPSVLAAVKAVTDPTYNLYGVNATTSPAIPVIVINGPIRNELGIHCQQVHGAPDIRQRHHRPCVQSGYDHRRRTPRKQHVIGCRSRQILMVFRRMGGGTPCKMDSHARRERV